MMDAHGVVQDFVLGLPELLRQHSGINIASVIATTLTNFGVNKDSVGYFVLITRIIMTLLSLALLICTALAHQSGVYAAAVIYSTLLRR